MKISRLTLVCILLAAAAVLVFALRRPQVPSPNGTPQQPDMTSIAVPVDSGSEPVIVEVESSPLSNAMPAVPPTVAESSVEPAAIATNKLERLVQTSTSDCVVFDVPLLVESDRWRPRLDTVLVVDCTQETQVVRVMARNGWPRQQVESIIAQQSPRARRLASADSVIWNDGVDLPALQDLVLGMARRLGL